MYPNLNAEIARKGLTRNQLASTLGMTPTTLGLKLNGKAELSLPECLKIKKALGVNMAIDELFDAEVKDG